MKIRVRKIENETIPAGLLVLEDERTCGEELDRVRT